MSGACAANPSMSTEDRRTVSDVPEAKTGTAPAVHERIRWSQGGRVDQANSGGLRDNWRWRCRRRLNWRARIVFGRALATYEIPIEGRGRAAAAARRLGSRVTRPGGATERERGCRGGPRGRLGEGGRPPPGPVALHGQAPSRERPVKGPRPANRR